MIEMTIFTAPKPFIQPHICTIQTNAIRSWQQLGSRVEIFMVGDEPGIGDAARSLGVGYIPEVERSPGGTPLIRSIFGEVRKQSQAALLAFVNADIIVMPEFLDVSLGVAQQKDQFLIVGQRWDMEILEELDFSQGWEALLRERITTEAKLHLPAGSDYFIFPATCFQSIPDFTVGRAGWDNWMLYFARRERWPVVNATRTIHIIHQKHDYSHLPNSLPHYRHSESGENVRLAGGRRTIFSLHDTDYLIEDEKVRQAPLSWKKLMREIEIFPLIRLRSRWLSQLFFALFHPQKAYKEFRFWLGNRKKINT